MAARSSGLQLDPARQRAADRLLGAGDHDRGDRAAQRGDQAHARRRAVFECGAGAAIDGVTALVHAGLTGFDAGRRPTVSLPGHYHRPEVPQVDIRGIASR